MNWNKTKNFLIVLFSLINLYLIIRTSSTVLNFKPATKVNSEAVSDTVNILKKNYGIEIDKDKKVYVYLKFPELLEEI